MASKVIAIARPQAALQIGLAGVPVRQVQDVKEAEKTIEETLGAGHEVVIVDESFRDGFSDWFSQRLARHSGLPLLIYCPAFDEEDAGTDAYINAILKPAVGFEIRLD